jgi:hypothetical protein
MKNPLDSLRKTLGLGVVLLVIIIIVIRVFAAS